MMEEKYNPIHVLKNTLKRFSEQDRYRRSEVHDFQIYIDIKDSEADKYIIGGYKSDCFLLKYSLRRSSSTITAPKNLFRDKDKLGKVDIKFKKEMIKSYLNYDEFWDDIKTSN